MQDFEKLGLFYLGRICDMGTRRVLEEPVLYDSKDLVTHAVCVGMTGSGKTGLCIGLLEEALLDGVPVIAIDPKGDLGNLALTFPGLSPAEFRPWIDEDEARRQGLAPDEFARSQAEAWSRGLAEWGQDAARVGRLRASADVTVYTPGSSAGLPLSVLRSFAAPPPAVRGDPEMLGDRVETMATSLLALAGIEADPMRSREHILIATTLGDAWRSGRDLDLASLIREIQSPRAARVGVMDVDSFFPPKERFELAMRFNSLLAAPGFAAWLEGDPLDISGLLYSGNGRPRASILSIAHLDDAERMFFVSLVLNEMLAWVRSQSGTSSLRAVLYMDEIFGYFPPVAAPPSKKPLLTLLKQARAFGLGVVLATQNPVDLDYKGLSNTGTWFIGRLQTERDKERVLEGLEGAASGGLDRARWDGVLGSLAKRTFVMQNVHEPAPVLFQPRWTMSYLRGPLTRDQIRALMAPVKAARPVEAPTPAAESAPARAAAAPPAGSRPLLPPEVPQYHLPAGGDPPSGEPVRYAPMLLGIADVRFTDTRLRVDHVERAAFLCDLPSSVAPPDWDAASPAAVEPSSLTAEGAPGSLYASLPPRAATSKNYEVWTRGFSQWLARSRRLELLRSPATGIASAPGESERDFRIRLTAAAREARDGAVEHLRAKYASRVAALEDRIRRSEAAVAREKEQAAQQKIQTAVSMGATILGAVLGRRAATVGTVGRATTAARGMGRSMKEAQDVRRAEESAETLRAQLAELQARIEAEIAAVAAAGDAAREVLETIALQPKRANISVQLVGLAWVPGRPAASGNPSPAP